MFGQLDVWMSFGQFLIRTFKTTVWISGMISVPHLFHRRDQASLVQQNQERACREQKPKPLTCGFLSGCDTGTLLLHR